MASSNFFLVSITVVAFLGIASAEYKTGRSLRPYGPGNGGYKAGRSLEPYQPEDTPPSYKPEENNSVAIKIQGSIYCRRYKDLIPMQGATGRVTCMVKDKYGNEKAPFSVETQVTDKKGYFLINLAEYTSPGYSFSNCRVFLDEPTVGGDCNVPTDTNDGLSGAHPSKPRRLSDKSMLYSVGPFAFKTSSY